MSTANCRPHGQVPAACWGAWFANLLKMRQLSARLKGCAVPGRTRGVAAGNADILHGANDNDTGWQLGS